MIFFREILEINMQSIMKIENLIPLRIQQVFIAHAPCHLVLKHLSCVKKKKYFWLIREKIFLTYQMMDFLIY